MFKKNGIISHARSYRPGTKENTIKKEHEKRMIYKPLETALSKQIEVLMEYPVLFEKDELPFTSSTIDALYNNIQIAKEFNRVCNNGNVVDPDLIRGAEAVYKQKSKHFKGYCKMMHEHIEMLNNFPTIRFSEKSL